MCFVPQLPLRYIFPFLSFDIYRGGNCGKIHIVINQMKAQEKFILKIYAIYARIQFQTYCVAHKWYRGTYPTGTVFIYQNMPSVDGRF